MAAGRFSRVDEGRHAANLGAGLIAACAALILGTVWFLPTRPGDRLSALALTAGAVVITVGLLRLPWERLPKEALLVFPALGLVGMTLGAFLTKGISPAYTGFFTVAVFFLAMTQSERVTMLAIPILLPCWMVCQGGFSATTAVKTPVTVGIWLLIGHNLARGRAANEMRIKGLVHAASTDPLTGLASRGELSYVLDSAGAGDAVVLLDLDGFKAVNDHSGHRAGDDVLAELGACVRTVLRATDQAVRYGGDEVMLLLPGASAAGVDILLKRLRLEWTRADRPTFSAGVAVRGAEPPVSTLHRADEALYEAKQRGRDRWSHAPASERAQLKVVR